MDQYLPTGNEMISLPKLNAATAGIETFTFLSMRLKGLVDVRGGADCPLFQPLIMLNGAETKLTDLSWHREAHWIPKLTARAGMHTFTMTVLTPVKERGFAIRLTFTASSAVDLTWGLMGCWASTYHAINEEKPLDGKMFCYESGWNNSLIFDCRTGEPLFSFAPMCEQACTSQYAVENSQVRYRLTQDVSVAQGETVSLTFFWGLGFEEVAAATSAKEMLRRGWDWEYQRTTAWLSARMTSFGQPHLDALYNTNLFFCMFYSTGITLDSEELVCVTSRSTRYYVSAAYWDRDTLLWAFPAILDADPALARQILDYVFTRQRRNLGIHSRYIDGTVLEPGFELDELLAPILALASYLDQTGDADIKEDPAVRKGLALILARLHEMRHPNIPLYETFLQPTDDEIVYPYLTYNNVLVWYALHALARLFPASYGHLAAQSEAVKAAIHRHCVVQDAEGQKVFAWSVDLAGRHNLYDEPPGSLQLLPYYGFCSQSDPIWRNTAALIRSPAYSYSFANSPVAEIGCAHAPYPWILSLCNSLLSGHAAQAFQELSWIEMDNGIACESVDLVTGCCTTGAAFATCAGFLCHSMKYARKERLP